MPTPPGRGRRDAAAAADNGGADGWELLDRVIAGAPRHLLPGGRLIFTIFSFLGPKASLQKVDAAGFAPPVFRIATPAFPRLAFPRPHNHPTPDTGIPEPSRIPLK